MVFKLKLSILYVFLAFISSLFTFGLAQQTECPMTTPEENKALVLHYSEEAAKGNAAIVDEVLADDHIDHSTGGDIETVRGRIQGGVPYPFEDIEVTIEQVVAENDLVVLRSTVRATHDTVFAGVEPTGQEVSWAGIGIFRIECGKIAETWTVSDNLSLLQQVGAVPSLMEGGDGTP